MIIKSEIVDHRTRVINVLLGRKIRDFRKERGITLAELANKLQISTSYLSAIERGLRKPSIPTLQKISEELNISVAYLMGDMDDALTSEKLRNIRKSRELSRSDLAEISEIPLSTLEKYESGVEIPGPDDLKKLSEALNVPIQYFISQGEKTNSLGARLQRVRKEQGISVNELAERAGVSPGLISQIERGKTTPLLPTLENIARALNKPASFFLMENEDIANLLYKLSPDVVELLDDPNVQVFLRAVREFSDNELKYILNFIRFFKQNRQLL